MTTQQRPLTWRACGLSLGWVRSGRIHSTAYTTITREAVELFCACGAKRTELLSSLEQTAGSSR